MQSHNAKPSAVIRQSREQTNTIGGAVETCRRMLVGVSDTPWLDARILAAHVTGLDASAIVAYGDHRLDAHRRDRLMALAARRASGEPIAYLVGQKEFCGLRLLVDRRVLVPRPETEELVSAIVDSWSGKPARMLDVGTGSGAIACALAHLLPLAAITATDASDAALEVASANVEHLGLSERVELLHGDLFAPLTDRKPFDVIVANLPYVAHNDVALAADVYKHEPHGALFGGGDGLDVYRALLTHAPRWLAPDGEAYFECGPANAQALRDLGQSAFPGRSVSIKEDAAGRQRMVIVR